VTTPALPAPSRSRWQPLRIGLVDLFHYDVEEFHFRDGRLLLRGNNGTGKSKVLALTLPFLLDGDLSARRVEPDGDPGKRMEWNLLLGGDHPHSERLGYTWIEFGRLEETTGQAHFRTLACGLKAVSGRGIARHWFAVTTQRIDHHPDRRAASGTLSLLDATGTALSRDRLAEAVTGHGLVYDQAKVYRRAVDEALFALGEQRYAALVDLLIQLRQPQLSKRPNEAALSRALTEALPPMDQAVVADAAEAFRSLDEEKDSLRAASEAERAATAFLGHYRRYAAIAARRRARLPRTEHSRYEQLHRDLTQAQADRSRAEEERAEAAAHLTRLEESRTRLRAHDAALRESPEMRSARDLEQAAQTRERSAQAREQAREDRDQAAHQLTRAQGRLGAAENRLAAARERVEAAHARALEAAHLARVELPDPAAHPADDALRRLADRAVDRRRRTLGHLEELQTAAGLAEQDRRAAGRRLDDAETDATQAAQARAAAEEAAEAAGHALLEQVRAHAASCAELPFADTAGLLDTLQEWTRTLDGPYPARTAAALAHRARTAELADEAARLGARRTGLTDRTAQTEAELTVLRAGGTQGPPAPPTRTPGLRERREGAPLWRLVDFHDGPGAPDDAARAGLEAALQASGLLDAWVTPDGAALADTEAHDVLVAPDTGPVTGPSLADVLRPAADHEDPQAAAVTETTVTRLLHAVGLGATADTGTWAASDGRFRVGVLTGRWHKPAAEYLGEGARQEARRARITALESELAALAQQTAAVAAESAALQERRRRLDDELAALPDEAPLAHAHARLSAASDAARRSAAHREQCGADAAAAAGRAEQAMAELGKTADDLGLPADHASLAAVRAGLAELDVALAALWPLLSECTEAERQAAEDRAEAEAVGERAAEHALRAEAADHQAAADDERYATLRATVGAAVADLEERLAQTAAAQRACEAEERTTRDAHTAADRRASRAEGRIDQLEADVTAAAATRDEAVAALQRFTATGLLAVALPDLAVPPAGTEPWAATPGIALARAVESALTATDDSDGAWERTQRRLSEELKSLQDSLSRHGHTAAARMVEDGMLVDIVYQGREHAVPELAEALATEVAELTRLLSAHEREILETHLITEVAGTLQELIGAAERQVRAMNAELEDRPTSTGMKLRLVWRPSRKAPPGLVRARDRLRESADVWTPEDRSAVGEFLQNQIARQQTDDAAGSWLEHLTAALDYRAWHEFGVERHQSGRWVPATGPASGGERVLAVSVPLFAAASSHYASAGSPHAPRLVTLDEAFAGVDDDSRAKCLGLLHAFDLDVVMTSEREWACYPQVPGVAIAQLSRVEGVSAVLVTRWEWDGAVRARRADPVRERPADGSEPGPVEVSPA
jgi:uncharacterized protein (TIGR02680 family)